MICIKQQIYVDLRYFWLDLIVKIFGIIITRSILWCISRMLLIMFLAKVQKKNQKSYF